MILNDEKVRIPIVRYRLSDGGHFAWFQLPEGTWSVTHVLTGVQITRAVRERLAIGLGETLEALDCAWDVDFETLTAPDYKYRPQILAVIRFWTGRQHDGLDVE